MILKPLEESWKLIVNNSRGKKIELSELGETLAKILYDFWSVDLKSIRQAIQH